MQYSSLQVHSVQWQCSAVHQNAVKVSSVGCKAGLSPAVQCRSEQCSSTAPLQCMTEPCCSVQVGAIQSSAMQ